MRKFHSKIISLFFVLCFYRAADSVGRYYVIIRNIDGTNGNVYINFHGDHLSSSGEHQLIKCENYPNHPFSTKHTVYENVFFISIYYSRFISRIYFI